MGKKATPKKKKKTPWKSYKKLKTVKRHILCVVEKYVPAASDERDIFGSPGAD